MSIAEDTGSGIEMSANTRLAILRRAREILSCRWQQGGLRSADGESYCLLGACERAAYDLGFAVEDPGNSFDDSYWNGTDQPLGYLLGKELSIDAYADERYDRADITTAWRVNDVLGQTAALSLLDEYIVVVEQGRTRVGT